MPAVLVAKCPDPYQPIETTGDIVNQLVATRAARDQCAAQIDGVREWDRSLAELDGPKK